MDILAGIDKVFGQEMAKLYSEQIPEEAMRRKANDIWDELNRKSSSWSNSKFENEVERQLISRLGDAVQEILNSEETTAQIDLKAREIVDKIRQRAEEKMIESASDTIAAMFCNQRGFGLGHIITGIVQQSMQHS